MRSAWVIIATASAVAIGVLVWALWTPSPEKLRELEASRIEALKSNQRKADSIAAYEAVRGMVSGSVIAPATSIFPKRGERGTGSDNPSGTNIWRAWGFLDTQNTFGALVRLQWLGAVRIDNGQLSEVLYLDIEGYEPLGDEDFMKAGQVKD